MKKRIFIYGDSYSEIQITRNGVNSNFTWPKLLNNNCYDVFSSAIGGSSTEYSFLKFIKDVEEGKFKSNDVIIFQFSYVGRYNFKHHLEKQPWTSWYSKMIYTNDNIFLENEWHRKNKNFLMFYEENKSFELAILNQISYYHVIKTFSELNKDILFIVLNADENMYFNNINIVNTTNLLISSLSLDVISRNELISSVRIFKDVRPNHLSVPNLKIFANLIDIIIKTKNIEHLSQDKFLTKIYQWPKSFNDVINLINNKILPDDYDLNNLKKFINY